MNAPFVSILALGGTIASKSDASRSSSANAADSAHLAEPVLEAADLQALVGGARALPALRSESLRQLASGDLRFAAIAEVAQRIRDVCAEGACGVVVTQGTDTLEESAFQLDLLLAQSQPVVVTGAMRNPDLAGADGAANLLAAIRVAAAPSASNLGVLVVTNDEIHAARFAHKAHTHRPSAFASPSCGPLGWIVEDRVRIALRPANASPTLVWRGEPPEVPLVTLSFSASAATFVPFLAQPPAGLVIAGLGAGHAPSWLAEPIGQLAAKLPVILASRVGAGETLQGTYGYPGSETDLLGRGCISAGWLDPLKARVLLALLLGEGADRLRIAEVFSSL